MRACSRDSAARLAVVYTDYSGTLSLSQHIASDARDWLSAAGLDRALLLDDRTFSTLPDSAFAAPLVFKRSALSHEGTAQYYFGTILAHAGLQQAATTAAATSPCPRSPARSSRRRTRATAKSRAA